MLPLATEFPVKTSNNRAAFVAEVIAWLRGTSYSTVLDSKSDKDLDGANAHLSSATGEELRLRELRDADDWSAIGFRHDFPDDEGRLWRTEGVLRRATTGLGHDIVRLRTQCLARTPGAQLKTPRKPFLIKALLMNGWGGTDETLAVSDQPVQLGDNDEGLAAAKAVTFGEATTWLPTVYVSAAADAAWLLDEREIEKLAYDLGGLAHVVVEPSRAFSFRLRDESAGRNAYGGTVGISVPGQGIIRRYFLGWQIQDSKELALAVRAAATRLRSQMPAFGWDWTELQEQALRAQRERDRNRLTPEEIEQLYKDEIENLRDKIRQQEQQIDSGVVEGVGTDDGEFSTGNLIRRIGPEIYPGEVSDRLRFAARIALKVADQIGLEERSKVILQRVVDRLPVSPALSELSQDLRRATKDPKRIARELISLLGRHGYVEKSDNKHIRLEAGKGYDGLGSITLPKTPGEHRGLNNLRSQIENTLGITKLTD